MSGDVVTGSAGKYCAGGLAESYCGYVLPDSDARL